MGTEQGPYGAFARGHHRPGRRRRTGTLPAVRVDQVIPSLASRDAIGVHTLHPHRGPARGRDRLGHLLRQLHARRRRPWASRSSSSGRASQDRWLLYQSSIGSPVYDILAARTEPKLVNYHNITPAPLLEPWEPNVGYEVRLGRTQLDRLAPESRLAVADSAFNETELVRGRLRRHRRRARSSST